jgi:hypothetical protein
MEILSSNDTRPEAAARHSHLEILYSQTNNGTALKEWAQYHVQRVYPHFPDDNGLVLGTPSLAHNPTTNRTVLGFRVSSVSLKLALSWISYLMICELQDPPDEGARHRTNSTTYEGRWRCQDSGMENAYVPPECDRRYWKDPSERVFFGLTSVGPEDARLFFDESGRLGATMVMRGCHHHTPFGNSTALYSVYTRRWRHTHETWRVDGYPKLLDLREFNTSYLGSRYPRITKSWITIPRRTGLVADVGVATSLHYSVG